MKASLNVAFWSLATVLSHWRRHPVQAATWVVGLMLATALWSGVQALNQQARDSYDQAAAVFGGAEVDSLVAVDGEPFREQAFTDLRRQGMPVSPVLEGTVRWQDRAWQVVGVDPVTLPPQASAGAAVSLTDTDLTAFTTAPGQALVSGDTLRQLDAEPGERLTLDDGRTLPPLAVARDLPAGTLVMDIGIAQAVLDQPQTLTRLLLLESVDRAALPGAWGEQLRQVPGSAEEDLNRLTDSFHLNLTALGLLAFLVGLFIVHGATGLAFEQRRPLFRTLRACGVSGRQLVLTLFVELVVLALIAGSLGLLLGYGIAAALLPDVAASLAGLYGARVDGSLTLDLAGWFSGLAMSLAGALLASASSLWHAARLPVLGLARPETWQQGQRGWLRMQTLLGLGLLVLSPLVWWLGSGLVSGFVMITALLLGVALLLPGILGYLVTQAERRAEQPLWQWFWADARQQLSGLSLALMALLLALSANIGVGSMVDSFRVTFTGWLDQRLAAEVYVNVRDDEQGEILGQWLADRDEVDAILPTGQVSVRLQDHPVEINGIQMHATYEDHWPVIRQSDQAWARLAAGEGVLVSEQLANRLALSLGDRLTLPGPNTDWAVSVEGVYSDYGNPRGQILADINYLRDWHPGFGRQGYSLRVDPAAAPDLVADLRQTFALDTNEAVDQAQVKAYSEQVFERTFVATGALNTLTLGVAGMALFTSLLTLSNSRLPQLAPIWALGVTRRHLAALEWLRTLLLALLTALIAVPLGLVLAWCLVAVINVEAFGWRLPLYFFPHQWALLVGLAVVTALLATAWPMWQLRRRSVAVWTKVFAYEQ